MHDYFSAFSLQGKVSKWVLYTMIDRVMLNFPKFVPKSSQNDVSY